MVIGVIIAVVLGAIGVPWMIAIGAGVAYFLIALRFTPRSAFIGGAIGPKPRPGEVPTPGSTRQIDLSAADLADMSRQNMKVLAEMGPEFVVNFADHRIGNIGNRQGQYADFTVRLPADYENAAVARGRALVVAVGIMAHQSDDVREVRVQFIDDQGKRVAESIVDMSAAGGLTNPDDEAAMAAYAAAHTRTQEFDERRRRL